MHRTFFLLGLLPLLWSGCATSKVRTTASSGSKWSEIRTKPADARVINMKAVPLTAGKGKESWVRVPEKLNHHARIFIPDGPTNGVADYTVSRSGYLLVACNYDYQGNKSGEWQASRWTKQDFRRNGWRELTAADLDGRLVKGDNREQTIFFKKVTAGENGRIRCNKYDPPFLILAD